MPRKPTPNAVDADDSALLHQAIQTLIDTKGRGGLSYVAEKIGMTPSALQKRLRRPGRAFDAPTLRASLLILTHSREAQESPEPPEPDEDTPALSSELPHTENQ